jgi:hypothetical protein
MLFPHNVTIKVHAGGVSNLNPVDNGLASTAYLIHVARKLSEAMVRHSNRAFLGDDAPAGFFLHQNDSLETRLKQFSATCFIMMLDEQGDQLFFGHADKNQRIKRYRDVNSHFGLSNEL